jgi:hypothetical protein
MIISVHFLFLTQKGSPKWLWLFWIFPLYSRFSSLVMRISAVMTRHQFCSCGNIYFPSFFIWGFIECFQLKVCLIKPPSFAFFILLDQNMSMTTLCNVFFSIHFSAGYRLCTLKFAEIYVKDWTLVRNSIWINKSIHWWVNHMKCL